MEVLRPVLGTLLLAALGSPAAGCSSGAWAERGRDARDVCDAGVSLGPGLRAVGYGGLPLGAGYQHCSAYGGIGREWGAHRYEALTLPPPLGALPMSAIVSEPAATVLGCLGSDLLLLRRSRSYPDLAVAGPLAFRRGTLSVADSLPLGLDVHVGFVGVRFVVYPLQLVDFGIGFAGLDLDRRDAMLSPPPAGGG